MTSKLLLLFSWMIHVAYLHVHQHIPCLNIVEILGLVLWKLVEIISHIYTCKVLPCCNQTFETIYLGDIFQKSV